MVAFDEEHGYEESISIIRSLMKFVGLWPLEETVVLPSCRRAVTTILTVFALVIPQTRRVIIDHSNFNVVVEALTTCLINYYITVLKIYTMWGYKTELKKLLAQMHEDWQKTNTEEQRTMWSYAKMSRWIIWLVVINPFGTAGAYVLVVAASFKSNVIWQNGTQIRPLYLLSDFPFDTQSTPVYEIVIFTQCISTFFVVTIFSAYDAMYVATALHFSGQLEILQRRVRELVGENRQSKRPFVQYLKPLVRRYLNLVSHAEYIEDTFNKGFLAQGIGLSIALGLQGYNFILIISEDNASIKTKLTFIVIFTICNLSSIFMYCFNAQVLRDQSQALFEAAYQMEWYELPPKDAMSIVLMMNRCMRPVEITAGKFAPLTLEYFTKVMKTSVGYLSLLLAVKNKIVEE